MIPSWKRHDHKNINLEKYISFGKNIRGQNVSCVMEKTICTACGRKGVKRAFA
jgi:hypothetical protein